MGYHLTDAVGLCGMTGRLHGVAPASIAVLYVMAHVASDRATKREPARIYFAGWEYLARAGLGRLDYDVAAHRAVARAVRDLTDHGLIKDVGRRNGMRQGAAMYELLVDP